MRLPFFLRSRFFFMVITALAAFAGMRANAFAEAFMAPPPTNRQAAERALGQALSNLGIPEGNGKTVRFRTGSNGAAAGILEAPALEYLLGKGYRIEQSVDFPEVQVSLDTLSVIIERNGFPLKKTVRRTAAAHVAAVFRGDGETRRVYLGAGKFEDVFPANMLDHTGGDGRFLVAGDENSFGMIKPALFCLVVTGLLWLLYSYRG